MTWVVCHGGQHSNVGGVCGVLTWLTRVECWCGKRPRVSCVDDVLTLSQEVSGCSTKYCGWRVTL